MHLGAVPPRVDHQVHAASEGPPSHRHPHQLPSRQLPRHSRRGQEGCRSFAHRQHLLQGSDAVEGRTDAQQLGVHTCCTQSRVECPLPMGAFTVNKKRNIIQLLQGDLPSGRKRVLGMHQKQQLFCGHVQRLQSALQVPGDAAADQARVQPAGSHCRTDATRVRHRHVHLDLRVGLHEAASEAREQKRVRSLACTQAECTRPRVAEV
mmetsp:Transcript_6191/g.17304  ORF Transcript_6191/g.17304 Transcript_6191/m.17304 type:complete len:207 (-) Transcript_6191:709-1329(-)